MKQKNFSIFDLVQFTKDMEQRDLIEALRKHGTPTEDGGFEYHFECDNPLVAGYRYEKPCHLTVLAARVDGDNNIILLCRDIDDRHSDETEIDPDDIFAGHTESIAMQIKHLAA